MLTVEEVMTLEAFAQAKMVAGVEGKSRKIRWVHNAGVPDAANWLNGGELVLTTMLNMPEGLFDQENYIRAMVDKDVAGLVISVGRYITNIPERLCKLADMLNFPLIEIPYQARFVDIAKTVNERISQQNMQMVEDALTINQTLTQIVLQNGGFNDLATTLAQLVGHSISIETNHFEAIATENIAEVDEARRFTQQHGHTDPRLIEALETRGYLPVIRETLRPHHLPPMADVGLEMERLLAPIVVHGEIYGFMWIIADVHEISEIDRMAIESGATIAALMMLYQESVQSAESSLKGSLLSQLIKGDANRETILTDQSLRYGVDLRSPYVMLVVERLSTSAHSTQQIYRRINQLVQREELRAVVGQFDAQVIILAQADESVELLAEKIYAQLASMFKRNGHIPRLGVSATLKDATQVTVAHEQCQDVLFINHRLVPNTPIVYFANLGYLHTLYRAGKSSLQNNLYVPIVSLLLDDKQADLLLTLEAYVDAGGNGVNTAEQLHIHRSTLNYRLSRIVQITGVDLQDPMVRTNLQIALKLLKLFGEI